MNPFWFRKLTSERLFWLKICEIPQSHRTLNILCLCEHVHTVVAQTGMRWCVITYGIINISQGYLKEEGSVDTQISVVLTVPSFS